MKGQPGGSQPWSRQQPGYNDLQQYQQQLMYKQLQDFQRQQQLHHLQNSQGQLSSLSKQAILDQLPPVVNGVPVSDASKYFLPNENMLGNANWIHKLPNGIAYPQDQGQMPHPAVHPSEQIDQYLFGTPMTVNKNALSQFSNFQAISNAGADTLGQFNAFNSFQGDQGSLQGQMVLPVDAAVNQKFPGKFSFYQHSVQDARERDMSDNFEKTSTSGMSIHQHNLGGGRATQIKAQEIVKLDATEQRILFSKDDDTALDGAYDTRYADSEGMYRNLMEGDNGFDTFSSLQSGSWSALMQSAVAETSSGDAGLLHNEWSSLNLRQEEPSTSGAPAFAQHYAKQQTDLMGNLPTQPTPFPLFSDTVNVEKTSIDQTGKDGISSHFQGSNVPQMYFGDASAGVWSGFLGEQVPSITPVETRPNLPNFAGSWVQQGNTNSLNGSSQLYSRSNGWTQSSGDAGQKTQGYESWSQQSHAGNPGEVMLTSERDALAGKTWGNKSSNLLRSSGRSASMTLNDSKMVLDASQQYFPVQQSDHGFQARSGYSEKIKVNDDNGFQVWASPTEIHDRTQEKVVRNDAPDEGYLSNTSHQAREFNSRGFARERDYSSFGVKPSPPPSGIAEEQESSHIPSYGSKNQEGEYTTPQPQFDVFSSFKSTNDVNKGQLNVAEKGHSGDNVYGGDSRIPNSRDESPAFFGQHERGHSGQNMLELLHKLDQTKEANSVGSRLFSNRNMFSDRPNASAPQASTSQVTGLHLSLPSQLNPTNTKTFSHSSRPNLDHNSTPVSPLHEVPKETMDERCQSSDQRSNENSQAASISSSSPRFFSQGSLQQQQKQQQFMNSDELSKNTPDRSSPILLSGVSRDTVQNQSKGSPISGNQHGAFSAMLHNVWTQVSDKVKPNLHQSEEQSNQKGQGKQQSSKENSVRQILSGRSDILSRHPAIGNSPLGMSSFVQSYPQDANKSKLEQSSQPEKQQAGNSSLLNAAASGRGLSSSGPHHSYSLLQQVQSMKAVDSDAGKRLGKRLKSAVDFAGNQSQFSLDSKMLCFSSEGGADDSAAGPSEPNRKELESRFSVALGPHVINTTSSSSPSVGISNSRTPSWFAQYEKLRNEKNLSDQKKEAAVQPLPIPTIPNSNEVSGSSGKTVDLNQLKSFLRPSSSAVAAADHSSPAELPMGPAKPVKPPKRKRHKSSLSDRSSWRNEITGVSSRLSTISMAETSWAQAANRLIDKVEDEPNTAEDVQRSQRARRRLVRTTHLMQQLLPALPAKILRADATSHYESIIYLSDRLVLGRACESISNLMRSSSSSAATTEDFIARVGKMEDDLTRLEGGASIAELRVECQDLERFSIINRFARFHSRGQPTGVESLPTPEPVPISQHPQRYVAALPMPTPPDDIAEGIPCFSL